MLKFLQPMKHLWLYIPYKIFKHSLIRTDFITSVYELFDNPSYTYSIQRQVENGQDFVTYYANCITLTKEHN